MQTSGLVLDVYDDYSGAVLRQVFPDFDAIPARVKEAHVVTVEDQQRLPDDVFALVLVNGAEKLKKYACIDEGNTVLSVAYFLQNAGKLPEEAQKVAASNLLTACSWYDIEPPAALEKMALGVGGALTALTAVPIIKGTGQAIKENMSATKALEGAGHGIVTPQLRDAALGRKLAEASGTDLMPSTAPADPSVQPSKTVVKKTASMGHQVHGAGGHETPPDLVHPPTAEQAGKHPQARSLHPTVDVTHKDVPKHHVEKKASRFAVPSQQRYPLDSYAEVKQASAYYNQYYPQMVPAMRREFAENLVKRASELDVAVSDTARKYGSSTRASEAEIKAAFDARRLELHEDSARHVLDGIERVTREKMWKEAGSLQPVDLDVAVELLAEFDKVAGLDHHYDRTIPDPYYSIYGFEKSAEDPSAWSEVIGNEMVTAADLKRLAAIGAFSVKTTFNADFQKEFLKDPVGTFKGLPLEQKKMLARMANSTQPGVERTYY